MKKRFMAIMLSAITMACSVSAVYAECAFSEWNGKNVSMTLSQELSENGSEKIDILLGVSMDKTYVYKGKTWSEYAADYDNSRADSEKMHELVKMGDYLKYGEKLYTAGTPDGEKWSEAYYNEKVECYGEELLSKYIVNGEFLQDKLIADTEAFEKEYDKAYREAYTAVSQYSTENVYKELQQKDVDCDYDKDKNKLVIHMTADEFADLSIDNVSLYQLDLPVSDDGEPICAEAALYPVASPVDTVIVCGDANNDSAIDARDASAILIAYANSSSDAGYKLNHDDIQKMDADENNIVDSRDASFVLAYYAFTSANGKGTLKDYIKNIKKC